MRRRLVVAATFLLAAAPSWAQTPPPDRAHLGPRTLVPAMVACTDLPITAVPVPSVVILGGQNPIGRTVLYKGDVVVLNSGTNENLGVGQRFVVRRLQGTPKQFPKKGEGFGAVRTAGWLTITAVNETTALAMLDFTCDAVSPGDFIESFTEPILPPAASALSEPQFDERARLIFGVDRRSSFANGDLLSIDRGTAQGVPTGARYAIYRDRHDGLPLVHVGDAVVVETSELTSKVVLVMVRDAISADDIAVPRRAP
ncbi:MAG: hypothetical protein ABI665_23470 [Vicinamibacterales bacterium]